MTNLKTNNSGSYKNNLNCDLCKNEGTERRDTQKRTIICQIISRENLENIYTDFRSNRQGNITDQLKVVRMFKVISKLEKL